jgi:PhzF family phenazine biosynthesis protein
MRIPLYQVDAFTSRLFRGNPAAICPLDQWLPDETLQAIAAENNLAETAFYVPTDVQNGGPNGHRYHLRWFTPGVEVDLCGHATLAAAHVILDIRGAGHGTNRTNGGSNGNSRVTFDSKGGELTVERDGELYTLDFPARPPAACDVDPRLVEALGAQPALILGARDYLCVFETEDQVRALTPNMDKLAAIDRFAFIVTAPGSNCDFVSRFFAPAKGVPEDPVTGSAHCTLIPYWSKRLGKTKLHARQISKRGGELWSEDLGDRVKIAGNAVKYLEGEIEVA